MDNSDILRLRLYNTGLSHSRFASAAEAVSHLGAVQAQDVAAAKWALALRVKESSLHDIEGAFNEGAFLRVHVMRPTWHFVMPADICWMLDLTAARVKSMLASANRKLELDDVLFARTNTAIVKALQGGKYLTRQELRKVLTGLRIETNVQRLAHIVMRAELDGLICSGPKRGNQLTYALLEERVARPIKLSREQALAELASRYFASHGPAQLVDFAWWSGLLAKDAQTALDSISSSLERATFQDKTYWYTAPAGVDLPAPSAALLLSVYDEYTIAYGDRSAVSSTRDIERMIAMGNALTAVIILDGTVAGTWRRAAGKHAVEIELGPFRALTGREQEALATEVARYQQFVSGANALERGESGLDDL